MLSAEGGIVAFLNPGEAVRGYTGIINTAASPRAVDWHLKYGDYDETSTYDGSGQVTIPAGGQRTVYSPYTHRVTCGDMPSTTARVQYDSSGWSDFVGISTDTYCA